MTSPAEGDPPGRREIALAFAVAVLVAVALFPRALFGGATFFHYDTWLQNLTFRAWWFEQLRAGHFATWCPGMFAGYPLFAETQTGPLYPPVFVLFSLLPATLAFSWSVALHLVLGGTGAYLLARRFGAGPAAAALAGVAFESSGFLVTHVVHFNLLIGAAWMPWIPWLVTRTFDGSRVAPIALAAVLAGLLLGAHPYATLMALVLAAWTFVHRAGRSPAAWTGGASAILAAGLLAVALAAVQVVPTREFLPQTTRGEAVSWDFLTFGSWEPWRIVTLVAPDRVGTPVDDTFWGGPDWSHYAETCAYVGTATIALAAVALVLVPARATWPAVLAAISFVLMLGRFTPAYRVLTWLPLFQSTRLPSRFALPFTLALAILAAIGLDALVREPDARRRRRALLVGGILIVGLGALAWAAGAPLRAPGEMADVGRMWSQRVLTLSTQAAAVDARIAVTTIVSLLALLPFAATRRPRALFATLPVVVVAIELISWGRAFNPTVPAHFVTDAPPAVASLPHVAPRPRIFRQGVDEMWTRGPAGTRTDLVTPGWRGHERTYESGAWTLPPNSQLLYDVDSGEGFTSLLPLDWLDWMGLARQPGATPRPDLTEAQADLLSIDAVVSTGSGIGGERWEARALPGDVYVSHNVDPLPRARLARSWRTQPLAHIGELVRSASYDPREVVLLEEPPPGLAPEAHAGAVDVPLIWREAGPDVRTIDVPRDVAGDAIVVLAERYDPDWRATIDGGADLPLFRAEGLFLAFVAPDHGGTVRLEHAPSSLRTGAFVSIAALLAALGWGWIRRRRRYEFLSAAPHRAVWAPAAIGAAALLLGLGWWLDAGGVRAEGTVAAFRAAARRSWDAEATAAWQAGAVPAVIELLERSLRLAPDDANSWSRLGLAYRTAGRESEAELAFRKALAIDPQEPRARRALGTGNLQGDRDNATAP